MAKQPPRSANASKVKVRVIEFEMDGSDESIQDTMKTLAAAFNRGGHVIPPARRLKSEAAAANSQAGDEQEQSEDEEVEDDKVEDVVAKAPSAPKRPKKLQTYDILDDIRFDATKVPLEDFAAKYDPKSDLKKYLVIASWCKDQLKLSEINVRHWYTAYKYLKWTIPNDPAQPIRDHRAAKRLSKGVTAGHSYINHIGEKDLESLLKAGK
jgi:hypothetical protein